MAITTAASRLGTLPFTETGIIELLPQATLDDVENVIHAVYRQLLGNVYLLSADRLVSSESSLRDRKITVQQFVRQVAKSELYKTKYFYGSFQSRVIELNYKHLLGRAPYDESEIALHLDLYETSGYDADIDSYIDSEEYQTRFGENIVPYFHSLEVQTGHRTVGFTRFFQLYRGYANSDRSQIGGNSSRLAVELGSGTVSPIVAPSGDNDGWAYRSSVKGETSKSSFGGSTLYSGRLYRLEFAGINQPGYPSVRRTNQAFNVRYDELLTFMQRVRRSGGKLATVTPV
ncbi:MAG: photosystem I reaction center subunit XII [Cyanobacteria bacterium WB6_1B_304]|jgi:phycocyanin-associated rod linker protein|nr:photosystem I reaction center subunit XII [Cyanobacteria bacterium WB6_1B_304]